MSSSTNGFQLQSIQTFVLKLHINCNGCKQKVKKLLSRIQGVYTVSIDAKEEKVTVTGNVDAATLINKLARHGKHAHLCPPTPTNQNNEQHSNPIPIDDDDDHNISIHPIPIPTNRHMSPSFSCHAREEQDSWRRAGVMYLSQSVGAKQPMAAGYFDPNMLTPTMAMAATGGGDGNTMTMSTDLDNFYGW